MDEGAFKLQLISCCIAPSKGAQGLITPYLIKYTGNSDHFYVKLLLSDQFDSVSLNIVKVC